MSSGGFNFNDDGDGDSTDPMAEERRKAEFQKKVAETFASHEKSRQYKHDHPDSGWEQREIGKGSPPIPESHNDGEDIWKSFGLEPLPKFLARAARMKHPVAQHPKALAHFLTHIKKWEKWELGEEDPQFGDEMPRRRRELLEWYLGYDKPEGEERQKAKEKRQKRLRPGGTGLVMHGEQGTTKTTGMHWLIANMMEVNQEENVLWMSTLDDTEWQTFAPWATICFPSGVDVKVTINPHAREYRDLGAFEVDPELICRQVIRYDDPEHLMHILADRTPGQFYAVYPDPKFRKAQSIVGYPYESMWDAESTEEATPLGHYWFALTQAIQQSAEYNDWTTLVGDEAHKWLRHGKGNDEHDWWDKIEDWATYWGDARKNRLSVILAVHKWTEISNMVRDKVRWGATMNGEDFPSTAPLDGKNKYDQDLGDLCIWNNLEWNHTGYPDLKRNFSVSADIKVSYPGFDQQKDAKS